MGTSLTLNCLKTAGLLHVHYRVIIHAVALLTGGLMHSSWLCGATGLGSSLMDTEYYNTSAISDLGLFVLIRGFVAIPVLLGLLS